MDRCATRKDPVSERLVRDNLEIYPIILKPKTEPHGRAVLQVPLTSCSLPRCPFPVKSPALSAHVSPQTTHFPGLDKSPFLAPGRGLPCCNSKSAGSVSCRVCTWEHHSDPSTDDIGGWLVLMGLSRGKYFCSRSRLKEEKQ